MELLSVVDKEEVVIPINQSVVDTTRVEYKIRNWYE